jgi:Helicase conserved C-terminal domain
LANSPVPLAVSQLQNGRRRLTSNRFKVAAAIADRFERAGLKVIIFCDSVRNCVSTAKSLNEAKPEQDDGRNQEQSAWRDAAIAEVGDVAGIYDAGTQRAAVHHGDLLPDERRLVESVFRQRDSSVNVLAATSTLAQGLNLPCDVVILAGTDRVDDTDPDEKGRSPLMPHEILNALGRAGRAGQAATGLSIVIPGDLIGCDLKTKRVDQHGDLAVAFSDGDQCLPLADPLAMLFDQIEVHGATRGEAQYLLRRLAIYLSADQEKAGFDALARRTFGFYKKRLANPAAVETWLVQRRTTLAAAIQAATEPLSMP